MKQSIDRPSRLEIHVNICKELARRSTCKRGQVGAIIVQHGRIISSGYNGPASGESHCIECDTKLPCKLAFHAERNAIDFARFQGIDTRYSILFSTHAPCLDCARDIVRARIKKVVWLEPYRDDLGLEYLHNNRIELKRYED